MWFFGLIVVLLIGAVAVVASGRWGAMGTAYDDRPDMTVPARQALTSVDIETARFAVGLRGYRMDEVDTLLERIAREVAERDRRIADLERAVAPIVESPEGHGFTSKQYDDAAFDDTGTQPPILVGGDFPEPAEAAAEPVVAEPPEVGEEAAADEEDEPETRELPKAVQRAQDEYERLQAEARAVLEAQSQPVTPRRTPARQEAPAAQEPEQPQEVGEPQEEQQKPAKLTPAQQYDRLRLSQPRAEQSSPDAQ